MDDGAWLSCPRPSFLHFVERELLSNKIELTFHYSSLFGIYKLLLLRVFAFRIPSFVSNLHFIVSLYLCDVFDFYSMLIRVCIKIGCFAARGDLVLLEDVWGGKL